MGNADADAKAIVEHHRLIYLTTNQCLPGGLLISAVDGVIVIKVMTESESIVSVKR